MRVRRVTGGMVLGITTIAALLFGCGSGDVLSAAEFADERQKQIDEITSLADVLGSRTVAVSESLAPCYSRGGENSELVQGEYLVNMVVKPDARVHLDATLRPQLEAEGWDFRDRSARMSQMSEKTLDYYWTREEERLSVTIWKRKEMPETVIVSSLSRCAKDVGLSIGEFFPGEEGWLQPTVPGPRYEDARPMK